jgi:hypothetical protein
MKNISNGLYSGGKLNCKVSRTVGRNINLVSHMSFGGDTLIPPLVSKDRDNVFNRSGLEI